jgi:hypothetical protein
MIKQPYFPPAWQIGIKFMNTLIGVVLEVICLEGNS